MVAVWHLGTFQGTIRSGDLAGILPATAIPDVENHPLLPQLRLLLPCFSSTISLNSIHYIVYNMTSSLHHHYIEYFNTCMYVLK